MKRINPILSIQFFVLFWIILVPTASAQIFDVTRSDDPTPDGCNSGTDCSLRESIIAANDVGSGTATIQLEGGETYTLSIPNANPNPTTIEEFLNATNGALKILNTEATIRIEATGSGMATIDANNIDRVFVLFEDTVVEMEALEITGGMPGSGGGGGIYVIDNTNLEITNSSIIGNYAGDGNSFGGGMTVEGSTVSILGSTISNNESGFQGGGLRITDGKVGSNITIQNSTITNNDGGSWSGGIYTQNSNLTIIESTISENRSNTFGGGIRVSSGVVVIDRSAIINNDAMNDSEGGGLGGGINIGGGELLIINSTISGNETGSGGYGGAMHSNDTSDATINIVNTTITDNSSWLTGGISNGTSTYNVANSIIADQALGDDCSTPLTSNGYNFESAEDCGFTLTGDMQNSDPLLGLLQDNGGPVYTHAISDPLSPAINNGSNTLYTNAGGNLGSDYDANGNPRVFNAGSGGIIDIGAYEFQGEPDGEEPEFAPFITTWEVETGDLEISIPMIGNGYNFTVDWGDGTNDMYSNDPGDWMEHSMSHTFSEMGEYSVEISGDFPRLYINNDIDIREKIIDITQWGDIEWTSMEFAFSGARNLDITAVDAPDLSKVTSMRQMFRLARNFNGNIGHWNTETITDMNGLFWNAEEFNHDIGGWNTGMVSDMENMFDRAETFNRDIGGWNTGNVETMQGMFKGANTFNQNLNNWNTGNVTDMSSMFNNAESFNGDISNWNTGKVETMRNMFGTARIFNQDISGWVTDNVTDMALMFFNTDLFNAAIGGWNTSKVDDMFSMFGNSKNFNRDLSNWDVSGVIKMRGMFQNAESYNHSLGNWEIGALDPTEFFGGMIEMLNNSGLSTENYDATLAGWAAFVDQNNVPINIALSAEGLTYCDSESARQLLTDDYNWTFTGDSHTEACGAPIDSPAIPQLSLPINNTVDVELPVTLQWEAADHADAYSLQISSDDEFIMIVAEADSVPETSFEVNELELGSTYYWRVSSHGNGETSSWSAVWSFEMATVTSNHPKDEIPKVAALLQNYPNPFNPATMIPYDLPASAHVKVEIYDMLGRHLITLIDGMMPAGSHQVQFNADNISSGIYLVRLETSFFTASRKLTLMK